MKSSNVSVKGKSGAVEMEVLTIKANDKKSISKTSSLEVELNSTNNEKYLMKLEAKDKKPFKKSKNIYLLMRKDDDNYIYFKDIAPGMFKELAKDEFISKENVKLLGLLKASSIGFQYWLYQTCCAGYISCTKTWWQGT